MEEVKRGPGRPAKATTSDIDQLNDIWPEQKIGRKVSFVQMHDAFTPLQMAPIMSLSSYGAKAMKYLTEGQRGIEVEHGSGRKFVVPYGNISFYELE